MQQLILALGVVLGGLFSLLLARLQDNSVPSEQAFKHTVGSVAFVPHKAEIRNLQQEDMAGYLRQRSVHVTWVTLFGRRLAAPTARDDQRQQVGPQDSSALVPRPRLER